jgi:hypothetical protein
MASKFIEKFKKSSANKRLCRAPHKILACLLNVNCYSVILPTAVGQSDNYGTNKLPISLVNFNVSDVIQLIWETE